MTTSRIFARRSMSAVVVLGLGLTLAACGDDEQVAPSAVPPSADAPTEAPSTEAPSTDVPSVVPSEELTEDGSSAEAPTSEEPADGDPSAGDSPFEITWPEGWQDLSELTGVTPPAGVDIEIYGEIGATDFASNGTVIRYPESYVAGRDYDEMLAVSGTDAASLETLPGREISGRSVVGYIQESTAPTGVPITQHLYGIPTDDDGLVEIVFSAASDRFESVSPTFDATLDSVVIP